MAWQEPGRSDSARLADQLADSSRPTVSEAPNAFDNSGSWWFIPVALLLGLALTAGGVAMLVTAASAPAQAFAVALLGWGVSYLSQYGTLAWYVLQVPRLRRARIEAALTKSPVPRLTDFDVKQFSVPMGRGYRGWTFGLLDPGDGPTPLGMTIAQTVGIFATGAFLLGSVVAFVASLASR